jgi:hypothetical protein
MCYLGVCACRKRIVAISSDQESWSNYCGMGMPGVVIMSQLIFCPHTQTLTWSSAVVQNVTFCPSSGVSLRLSEGCMNSSQGQLIA